MIILMIRKSSKCASVGIGSDKHSAYDLYQFNYPLSSVILFKAVCFSIIILSENFSETLFFIWEF